MSLFSNNSFLIILFLAILFLLLYLHTRHKNDILRQHLEEVLFQKKSQSSKYGKISEQFMPFLDSYPFEPSNFRFIGTPIDGIQFEEDKIIFMEFKTNNSQLSSIQKNVKDLIQRKEIEWREIYLK